MSEETKVEDGLGAIERTVQNGENAADKTDTSEMTPGNQEGAPQDSNNSGWITALPQRLREGVKAEEYSDLHDYISKLQAAANTAKLDEKAFSEGWDEFEKSQGDDRERLGSLNKIFKDSKVPAKVADEVYKAVEATIKSDTEKAVADAKARSIDLIVRSFGENTESRMELANKGLASFMSSHPVLNEHVRTSGVYKDPAFLALLAEYQEAVGERQSPRGNAPAPMQNANDPYGIAD